MSERLSHLEGIGLAIAAFTLWVLTDATMKLVGRSVLPSWEIIGFMGLVMCACLALYSALRGEIRLVWPAQPRRQLVRSLLDLVNNLGVVIALRHVSLTLFYILIFSAPLVITVLAAVFLHERIEVRRVLAVLAGFAGVVIAVNPFGAAHAADWIGFAACMACVAVFSTNMVWSRVLTQTETPESLTFFSGAVMSVAGFAMMLAHSEPVTARQLAGLVAIGIFCAGGSICFFLAVKHTSASTVSQYHYTQLLTGALVSWLVWRELPTLFMALGGSLIVASGLYIALLASRGSHAAPGA